MADLIEMFNTWSEPTEYRLIDHSCEYLNLDLIAHLIHNRNKFRP